MCKYMFFLGSALSLHLIYGKRCSPFSQTQGPRRCVNPEVKDKSSIEDASINPQVLLCQVLVWRMKESMKGHVQLQPLPFWTEGTLPHLPEPAHLSRRTPHKP